MVSFKDLGGSSDGVERVDCSGQWLQQIRAIGGGVFVVSLIVLILSLIAVYGTYPVWRAHQEVVHVAGNRGWCAGFGATGGAAAGGVGFAAVGTLGLATGGWGIGIGLPAYLIGGGSLGALTGAAFGTPDHDEVVVVWRWEPRWPDMPITHDAAGVWFLVSLIVFLAGPAAILMTWIEELGQGAQTPAPGRSDHERS